MKKNNFWAHISAEIQNGAKIGKGTKIWHNSQVQKGAEIGENCVIGHNCLIASKARLGRGVKIQSNTDVWDFVELEDFVFVGPSAVFTNDPNPRAKYPKSKYPQYGKWQKIKIKEGATIGANATIICGNSISEWAMIGAGAVVTKNIPGYAIAIGVPARVMGWVCECGNRIEFGKDKTACKVCKRKYKKEGELVCQIK